MSTETTRVTKKFEREKLKEMLVMGKGKEVEDKIWGAFDQEAAVYYQSLINESTPPALFGLFVVKHLHHPAGEEHTQKGIWFFSPALAVSNVKGFDDFDLTPEISVYQDWSTIDDKGYYHFYLETIVSSTQCLQKHFDNLVINFNYVKNICDLYFGHNYGTIMRGR